MSNGNGNGTRPRRDYLLVLLAALLAAFATGVGAYVSLARDVVTRGDLQTMLDNYSPYVRDRSSINTRFDTLQLQGATTQQRLEEAIVEIATLRTQMQSLAEQIRTLQAQLRAHLRATG